MTLKETNDTLVTLRDYIEARLASLCEKTQLRDDANATAVRSLRDHVDSRFLAQEQAINVASRAMEQRLEKLNELRDIVTSGQQRFVTKDELTMRLGRVEDKAAGLEASVAAAGGGTSRVQIMVTWILAAAALFGTVIMGLLHFAGGKLP